MGIKMIHDVLSYNHICKHGNEQLQVKSIGEVIYLSC